jgi:hypothetical protein
MSTQPIDFEGIVREFFARATPEEVARVMGEADFEAHKGEITVSEYMAATAHLVQPGRRASGEEVSQ